MDVHILVPTSKLSQLTVSHACNFQGFLVLHMDSGPFPSLTVRFFDRVNGTLQRFAFSAMDLRW